MSFSLYRGSASETGDRNLSYHEARDLTSIVHMSSRSLLYSGCQHL